MTGINYSMYGFSATVMLMLELGGYTPMILIAFAFAVIFDIITGVYKSISLGQGGFQSKKLGIGIAGKVILMGIPLLFSSGLLFCSERFGWGTEWCIFPFTIWGLMFRAEVYSGISNLVIARTKEDMSEQDAITRILRLILGKINKILSLLMPDDKK